MFSQKLAVTSFVGVVLFAGDFRLLAQATSSQPATAPAASQRAQTQPDYSIKGDFALGVAVRKLDLTDEQKAKIKPIMEEAAKAQEALLAARSTTQLMQDYQAAVKAAKARGVKPKDDPACQELSAKITQESVDKQKTFEAEEITLRNDAIAKMLPILTEEQGRSLKLNAKRIALLHGTGSGYPKDGFVPDLEEEMLLTWASGVNLTEAQHQQAIAALQPLIGDYKKTMGALKMPKVSLPDGAQNDPNSPELKKAQAEFAAKRQAAYKPIMKSIRVAVEGVLTPEQKQAVADKRAKQAQRGAEQAVARIENPLKGGKFSLTEDQKRKAGELAQAACQAVLKLDPEDQYAEPGLALFRHLREDLLALLTPDQIDIIQPPKETLP